MTAGYFSGWRKMMSRAAFGLAGLVALALIAFGIMVWSGGDAVEKFCRQATAGLPTAGLAALAEQHHVRLVSLSADNTGLHTVLAHAPRSYGRHTCRVRHDTQVVIESRHAFAD